MYSLNTLQPGEKGRIISINAVPSIKRRLQDLGFVENAHIKCLYKSFANDPVAYKIKGSVIALRNKDARKIKIDKWREFN